MYLCQQVADMKLDEIAKLFGLKSYASTGSVIRQFHKRLQDDTRLQKTVNLIKRNLAE